MTLSKAHPHITYLLLLHNNSQISLSLIKNRDYLEDIFYIHLDKKCVDVLPTTEYTHTHYSKIRHNVKWGGFSIIETLLDSCREICATIKSDYVILLSGTDYPIKTRQYIEDYINSHPNTDFIQGQKIPSPDCHWLEGGRRRLECYALPLGGKNIATIEPRKLDWGNLRQLGKIALNSPKSLFRAMKIWLTAPKRRHPEDLIPYRGEMWWGLRRSTLETIINYLDEHPEYLEYHKNTCIPDEIFFNTLVYNLIPHEEISNSCLRYINWDKSAPGYSPHDITLNDTTLISDIISNPDYLFARKISDINVANYINKVIYEQ